MAGEVILIQTGQAGNQISSAFWKKVCEEHGINHTTGKPLDGTEVKGDPNVFFKNIAGKYVPRSVVVDLEPAVVEKLTQTFGTLFDPKCVVHGSDGAGNNYAVGMIEMGEQHIDQVLSVVESQVAETESLGGFMFAHSTGGGTGSGMGSLILKRLREKYPKSPIFSFSIFPSPKISETVVEPYNSVLTASTLSKYSSAATVLDNEALFNIAVNKLGIASPNLSDLNDIISEVMVNITASLRFSGTLNVDLMKLVTNLVPYEQQNFMLASTAPLVSAEDRSYTKLSVQDLTQQLFHQDNMLAACDPTKGHYLAASVLFRGNIQSTEINEAISKVKEQNTFVNWIPTGFKVARSEEPPANMPVGVALLANNSAIGSVFSRILASFDKLWSRKAFSHWYTDAGMEEKDLEEARNHIQGIVDFYKEKPEEN